LHPQVVPVGFVGGLEIGFGETSFLRQIHRGLQMGFGRVNLPRALNRRYRSNQGRLRKALVDRIMSTLIAKAISISSAESVTKSI